MPEFIFFIWKLRNSEDSLTPARFQKFLKSCETYIRKLEEDGKLISAQPIEWKGKIISVTSQDWTDVPFNEAGEVIGGYYHIRAKDLDDAIEIAKANPEFEYNPDVRIEVRPIKVKEESTEFTYPTSM